MSWSSERDHRGNETNYGKKMSNKNMNLKIN